MNLHLVFIVVLGFSCILGQAAPSEAETEKPTWKYHAPEWYRAVTAERKTTIARQLEALDLNKKLEWRTEVIQTPDTVTLIRQMHSMVFSRKTCAMTKVVIRQDEMAGADMCSLAITDQDGKKYYQRLATDGTLNARQEKLYIYMDGSFTPRSEDDQIWPQRVEVSYKLYSSAGLLTVHCKLVGDPGDKRIKEMKIINTLGRTPRPLDKVYCCYYKKTNGEVEVSNAGHFRVPSEKDQVLFEGMIPACFWADGRQGFQVLPLEKTWYQTNIDNDAPGDKLITVCVRDGLRYINLAFVQKKEPVKLASDYEFEYSVALLPYRKFKPDLFLNWSWGTAPQKQDDHQFRAAAAEGLDALGNLQFYDDAAANGDYSGADAPQGYTPMITPKNLLRTITCRDIAHKYGMKVGWGGVLSYPPQYPGRLMPGVAGVESVLTEEQLEHLSTLSPGAQGSSNCQEWRDWWLDNIYTTLRDLGTETFYFDLGAPFYGEGDVWVSQVEGNIKWFEQVRLLLNAFGVGDFLYHSGAMVTPMEGMADTSFPGEGIHGYGMFGGKTGTRVTVEDLLTAQGHITQATEHVGDVIPPGLIDTAYNPVLIGAAVTHNTTYPLYSCDLPGIYQQCLALGSFPMLNNWRDWAMNKREKEDRKSFSAEETKMFRRYLFPLRTFNIKDSEFHHPYDADYPDFATVNNKDAFVNIYARPAELLVTAALMPWDKGSVTADLNLAKLGFNGRAAILYDVILEKLVRVQENEGRLTISDVDMTDEGRIFYVKAIDNPMLPVTIWRSLNLDVLEEKYGPAGMEMKVKVKVAREEGTSEKLVIYCGDQGKPSSVTGARMEEYRAGDRTALLIVELPPLTDVTGEAGKELAVTVSF